MYPAFSLSGAFGFSSNNEGDATLSDMFSWESRAVKAGASFVFPIFNYGRLVNQVRVQDAQFQQAILNYQNTVLAAQQDVENGLSAFVTAQQTLVFLETAAQSARRSSELSMVQYKGGETDYTTVLTTEQALLSVDDSLASARGNVVQGLISIYRALGGGWEIRQGRDVVSDAVKTEMADRSNWGDLLEPAKHLPVESPEKTSDPATPNPSGDAN
jgi:outer membrane protein TolC